MEKVLVTGASGYIAEHCIIELLKNGYAVKGSLRNMSREEEVRNAIKTGCSDDKLEFCKLDLLEDDGWEEVCAMTDYCDDDLKIYGSLYETYGGGPSGGYLIPKTDTPENVYLYTWHQDWFTPKMFTAMPNKRLETKFDEHGVQFVKIVDDMSEEENNEDFNKT